ncbi:probable methyltransferase-like protein 24 [Mya arenaria]|uniref:probable methyltransferase-like protein 24 n=1 Tax=Mya arenaria TaxID=6604 RepID=UPI0022DF687D|nr:probable methyltransferase-like protein 24 [Mya arenaria]
MRQMSSRVVFILCISVVLLFGLGLYFKNYELPYTLRNENYALNGQPVNKEPEDYMIPDLETLKQMSDQNLMSIYWTYINRLQVLCKDVIRVGSLKDGGKEICIDEQYKPKPPCLVYSFGINNQFDFDKDVNRMFGCDVFCFDPSMKKSSFRVTDQIWFFNWGLGGENFVNNKGWDIKTLDVIRKELNHTDRPIDILKIDVEGDEWYTIPQMVSSGALDDVKQISMETHYISDRPGGKLWGSHPLPAADELYSFRLLYDKGFRIFMRERNMWSHFVWPGLNRFITNVNEISLIKSVT